MSHDASLCHCINGETSLFIEEERLSRRKHDYMPVKTIIEHFEGDHAGVTGLEYVDYDIEETAAFVELVLNKKSNVVVDLYKEHHILHALCGFYNSGFDEADVVVVDGMGNGGEVATRFRLSKPLNIHMKQITTLITKAIT